MNNDLRNEMIIVMNNENVCGDCQVKILSQCTKFVNNVSYMKKIKDSIDILLNQPVEINFWVVLPQLINIIIHINKNVLNNSEISIDEMKFVLYAVLYSHLDECRSILLNKLDQGDLRVAFINVIGVLLTKPKKIAVKKESIWHMLTNCICGDDGTLLL